MAKGGRIALGGKRHALGGTFFEPTIVTHVKPDMLELRVPVWVTDICFPDALSPSTVATVSRYGHIRSGLWAASLLLVPRDTSGAFLVVHACH